MGPSYFALALLAYMPISLKMVIAHGDDSEVVLMLSECCGIDPIPPASLPQARVIMVGFAYT